MRKKTLSVVLGAAMAASLLSGFDLVNRPKAGPKRADLRRGERAGRGASTPRRHFAAFAALETARSISAPIRSGKR